MWILNFLPDWAFYAAAAVGLAAIIIAKLTFLFPPIALLKWPLTIGGFLVVVASAWVIGGISTEAIWQARVKQLQDKLEVAEQQSKKENVRIETKVIKKVEVVKVRGEQLIQYVDREIVKYDNQCIIPKEFIKVHNEAAAPPDFIKALNKAAEPAK